MTALSVNATISKRNADSIKRGNFVLKSGDVCYAGGLLSYSNGTTTSTQVENSTDDAAANRFCGVADGTGDVVFPITGDGVLTVPVIWDFEMLLVTASITGAHLGGPAYAADSGSVSPTTSLGPIVGAVVEYVTSTSAWVHIRGAINSTSAT